MQTIEDDKLREREIYRVTIWGGVVNTLLVVLKFLAGILGHSAAMIADAVHSLSDFLTDIIVLIFVRLSNQPADKKHAYGHGKFETLATTVVGLALLVVGALILVEGCKKIILVAQGGTIQTPDKIAFWAAIASIILKELVYQFTMRTGKKVGSDAVVANAWHHRSDAFSSIGTGVGIGGAILLGDKWIILDPIAAVVVSIFIIVAAAKILQGALKELMEHSLDDEIQDQIRAIVSEDVALSEMHHLRTRKVGSHYAIEMHLRMPGQTTLYEAHLHSMHLEQRLKNQFGAKTHVGIHIEPTKINGQYEHPDNCPC